MNMRNFGANHEVAMGIVPLPDLNIQEEALHQPFIVQAGDTPCFSTCG